MWNPTDDLGGISRRMAVLDDAAVEALADALLTATHDRRAIPRLSDQRPGMDAADGYRVQQAVVRRRLDAGETIVGWKLGLTSKAMQDQLGVSEPDYAPILSGQMVSAGTSIPAADLIQPRVEAEIAFVLGSALRGPGVTREEALAATEGVVAAIEIIDSRIEAWKITLPDTIADLASSARVTIGARVVPIADFDVRLIGAVLERDPGQVVAVGAGAAALGDPAIAVAWAANTFGALGITMEPGQIVMTGAVHASVPVVAGEQYTARFDRLGSVTVRFS
jgi:2-keto-4-pentenoate hydratase